MSTNMSIDSESLDEICNVILKNDDLSTPYIFEDDFIQNVLPLLVRPWDKDNLIRYKDYVLELTNPLRIISREVNPKVLDVVPALYPRPYMTSVGEVGDATVSHLAEHIYKENTRSPYPMDHLMTEFLNKISIRYEVEDVVLRPLALILGKYGLAFEDDDGNPLYSIGEQKVVTGNVRVEDTPNQDSFSDEYED